MDPFILKYSPHSSSEVIGQATAITAIKSFLQTFRKGRYCLIQGPIGSGKTSGVYALAKELGYEILEINASDSRNKSSMEELLGTSVFQGSIFGNKKLVLVDEIDGLSGTKDRGGLSAIQKIAIKSPTPIIMIAQDLTNRKYNSLRKKGVIITFEILKSEDVTTVLRNVCDKEKVSYEEDALKAISLKSGGDVRMALNDLQVMSVSGVTKKNLDVLGDRDRTVALQDALIRVLKTTKADVSLGAYDNINEDLNAIFSWLEYNLPNEYKQIQDLAKAYDSVSTADVFFGRIRRWQYYRFYVYCYALLSAGVSLAKKEKYPGMPILKESSRGLMIWMTRNKLTRKLSIADKLSSYIHTSSKQAFKLVDLMKPVIKQNTELLKLTIEEIEWLNK